MRRFVNAAAADGHGGVGDAWTKTDEGGVNDALSYPAGEGGDELSGVARRLADAFRCRASWCRSLGGETSSRSCDRPGRDDSRGRYDAKQKN